MLTRDNVKTLLANDPLSPTDSEIDDALASINQTTVYDGIRGSLSVDIWDRTSPINGVSAEYFLSREDVAENGADDIYLISQNGQVLVFQPHNPNQPGFVRIPEGQGLILGAAHADQVAEQQTIRNVLVSVKEFVENARTT